MLAPVRLRISSHNLAIETGRFTRPKTPVNDRICIHCNDNQVENEEHFLLKCPKFLNERVIMYQNISEAIPSNMNLDIPNRFIALMTSQEKIVTDAPGRYVTNSMKSRNQNI